MLQLSGWKTKPELVRSKSTSNLQNHQGDSSSNRQQTNIDLRTLLQPTTTNNTDVKNATTNTLGVNTDTQTNVATLMVPTINTPRLNPSSPQTSPLLQRSQKFISAISFQQQQQPLQQQRQQQSNRQTELRHGERKRSVSFSDFSNFYE